MDKKIYNLEIFFESQKKSFVIISKNKITYEDLKQKTMREFRIPKEFEKDIKFTITIRNRPTILLTDIQIMNNFEEISKNNYYLKIILEVNNINYMYNSIKCPIIKNNPKIKPQSVKFFSIISTKDEDNVYLNEEMVKYKENLERMENKYQKEIIQLKEELEKVKSEKTNKAEIDIRKFDEKYRDLNNKNNILEQKINELENENKTLKIGAKKSTLSDNLVIENKFENESMIKEIEKIFTKLMDEHDNNIIKEINGLKDTVELIQKEQKNFYEKFGKNDSLEQLKENQKTQGDENAHNNKKLTKEEEENKNNSNNIEKIINENNLKINNKTINNSNGLDENLDELDNLADIIINDGEEAKNNNTQNSINKKKQMLKGNSSQNIKRNINFYEDESFLSSKSKIKIVKKPENKKKNLIEEIKNCFLETNEFKNKLITKKLSKKKDSEIMYSKYTAPSKNERMKIKNQKNIINYTNVNNKNNTSNEDIFNFEAFSEMNTDIQKIISGNKVNSSNSHKNIFIKMDDRKRRALNNFNRFVFSEKSITPSNIHISDRGEKNLYTNKNQINITPTEKNNKSKENIENYFLNIYQNIFFYGNNEYLNMLKISDKLLKKINDGISRYRFNIIEIKEYCIKYLAYTIIPIVNDCNTKPYQRKIIKDKIRIILDSLRIDPNYFDKDYKIFFEEKKEREYDDRSFNGFNITHAKINEFRKLYCLKEKEYPDEQIVKALIRYRGNRELAFQYLFY